MNRAHRFKLLHQDSASERFYSRNGARGFRRIEKLDRYGNLLYGIELEMAVELVGGMKRPIPLQDGLARCERANPLTLSNRSPDEISVVRNIRDDLCARRFQSAHGGRGGRAEQLDQVQRARRARRLGEVARDERRRGGRVYLAALQKNQIHIVAQLDAPERARVEAGERFAAGFYESVRAVPFYSFPVGGRKDRFFEMGGVRRHYEFVLRAGAAVAERRGRVARLNALVLWRNACRAFKLG